MPHLDGYGVDAVAPFVGRELELAAVVELRHLLGLAAHTTAEGNMIGHLIVKLHKV